MLILQVSIHVQQKENVSHQALFMPTMILSFSFLLCFSCKGIAGPEGPNGEQGKKGEKVGSQKNGIFVKLQGWAQDNCSKKEDLNISD